MITIKDIVTCDLKPISTIENRKCSDVNKQLTMHCTQVALCKTSKSKHRVLILMKTFTTYCGSHSMTTYRNSYRGFHVIRPQGIVLMKRDHNEY